MRVCITASADFFQTATRRVHPVYELLNLSQHPYREPRLFFFLIAIISTPLLISRRCVIKKITGP